MSPAAAAAAAAAYAVEPAGVAEGGGAGRLLGAIALEVNGGADWVAGASNGANLRSRRSHSARARRAAARSSLDDDDEEPDRGVRPGAVALAVSLNGGADFDGGDSSGVPGELAFEYVASITVLSLAPGADPTSAGTTLRVFGEASRSRPSSRACSGAARAETPPRRPSCARPTSAFSCARALGGGGDVAHAGVIALGLCTCGASLNLMCCFMRVGEFGMALNSISNQCRVMCGCLWALNTRQVLTAAQRQLAHGASLVLCDAARRTWLSRGDSRSHIFLACWGRSTECASVFSSIARAHVIGHRRYCYTARHMRVVWLWRASRWALALALALTLGFCARLARCLLGYCRKLLVCLLFLLVAAKSSLARAHVFIGFVVPLVAVAC